MILCDIGNSFLHFYYKGRIWKEKSDNLSIKKKDITIYYISVDKKSEQRLLNSHAKCVNLEPFINIFTPYKGLGIDRKTACKAIEEGIIIDAGSAITVDIVKEGFHLGGYILPGITRYNQFYKEISTNLDKEINFAVDLLNTPQNTRDAISYGILKSLLLMIQHTAISQRIYFTGGDGKYFSKYFENSIFDNTLVFKGMLKVLKENSISSNN